MQLYKNHVRSITRGSDVALGGALVPGSQPAAGWSGPLETEAGQRAVTQGHAIAPRPRGALPLFNLGGKG